MKKIFGTRKGGGRRCRPKMAYNRYTRYQKNGHGWRKLQKMHIGHKAARQAKDKNEVSFMMIVMTKIILSSGTYYLLDSNEAMNMAYLMKAGH